MRACGGEDQLVLVDLLDREAGFASKREVHERGLLHRAFSVLLWREGAQGTEVLVQRRAAGKYHSGGLWTNSCCSHPRAGEQLGDAVARRLCEELGVEHAGFVSAPREVGTYVYRAVFENGITEYEYDHVFVANYVGVVSPDPAEASEVVWEALPVVAQDVAARPERFSAWFPGVLALAAGHMG